MSVPKQFSPLSFLSLLPFAWLLYSSLLLLFSFLTVCPGVFSIFFPLLSVCLFISSLIFLVSAASLPPSCRYAKRSVFEQGPSRQFMSFSYSPGAVFLSFASSHLKGASKCSSVCIQLRFAVRAISGRYLRNLLSRQSRNDYAPVIAMWIEGVGVGVGATIARGTPPETFLFCSSTASLRDHLCLFPAMGCEGWQCVLNLLSVVLHICRPFIHPRPEDAPCRGDRTHLTGLQFIFSL